MLVYILAIAIATISFAFYLVSFFFPEIHRRDDFFWSGVGLFYALVLWVCAGQIGGAILLGHTAAVALIIWFGWETLRLRRAIASPAEKTQIPENSYLTQSIQRIVGIFRRKPKPKAVSETVAEVPESQPVAVVDSTQKADDEVVESGKPQPTASETTTETASEPVGVVDPTQKAATDDEVVESQSQTDEQVIVADQDKELESSSVSESIEITPDTSVVTSDQQLTQSEVESTEAETTSQATESEVELESTESTEAETTSQATESEVELESTSEAIESTADQPELEPVIEANITDDSEELTTSVAETNQLDDNQILEKNIDESQVEEEQISKTKDQDQSQPDDTDIAPSTESLIQSTLIEQAESASSKSSAKPKSQPAETTKKDKSGFSFGGMFGRFTSPFKRQKNQPSTESKKPIIEDKSEPWDNADTSISSTKPVISTDKFITVEVDPKETDTEDWSEEINPSVESETLPDDSKLKENIEAEDQTKLEKKSEISSDSQSSSSQPIETETLPDDRELEAQTDVELSNQSHRLLRRKTTEPAVTVGQTSNNTEIDSEIDQDSDEDIIVIVPDDTVEVDETIILKDDITSESENDTETNVETIEQNSQPSSTKLDSDQVVSDLTNNLDSTEIKVDESSLPPTAKPQPEPSSEDIIDVENKTNTSED